MSKSGSPTVNFIMGIPAWISEVAWSVMATVLEGFTEFTLGLREISTSISALTADLDVQCTILEASNDLQHT